MKRLPFLLSRAFNFVERQAAMAQGKGYGSVTVEQETDRVLRFVAGVPRLAIDIGGNVGAYTAALRKRHSQLEIHTFEPLEFNIDILKERFKSDPLVTIVPLAVSDTSGAATLYFDVPGSGTASLVKRRLDHFQIDSSLKQEAKAIRFEEYWKGVLHSRQVDLIKLDIEGHELAALQGFGSALRATKVLQFEFGGCNIDTRTFFQDFWYFFKEHDFELYRITPFGSERIDHYSELEEFFRTTNYIAVQSPRS